MNAQLLCSVCVQSENGDFIALQTTPSAALALKGRSVCFELLTESAAFFWPCSRILSL